MGPQSPSCDLLDQTTCTQTPRSRASVTQVCLSVCLSRPLASDGRCSIGQRPRSHASPSFETEAPMPVPNHHLTTPLGRNRRIPPVGVAASLERASGTAADKRTCLPGSVNAQGNCPRWPCCGGRVGCPLCEPDCRSATRPSPLSGPGPALATEREREIGRKSCSSPRGLPHQSDRGILSVIAFGSVKRGCARQNQANCWLGRACDDRLAGPRFLSLAPGEAHGDEKSARRSSVPTSASELQAYAIRPGCIAVSHAM